MVFDETPAVAATTPEGGYGVGEWDATTAKTATEEGEYWAYDGDYRYEDYEFDGDMPADLDEIDLDEPKWNADLFKGIVCELKFLRNRG